MHLWIYKGFHLTNNSISCSIAVVHDSEEVGLLHDSQELFLVHLAISIAISLINHLLKLFVGHSLTKLLGNTLQILEGDLACFIVIEKTKGLQNFIFGVAIQDLVSHHLEEFLVFDCPTAIIVDV